MPSADEILAGLTAIANQALGIAIAWHVVLTLAIIALAAGWRPSERMARVLLSLPLGSVAVIAFAFGNPFNGLMFSIGAAALVALGWRGRATRAVARGRWVTSAVGVASIAFGWLYPHFLETHPLAYLYAAPVGLVPCPTLAIAIGFALLGGGLGARAWSLTLAALGLAYALFGALRLGVYLDLGLMAGAGVLALDQLRSDRPLPVLGGR
ncbi:MAG TPA: hypothetical protein VK932_03180 [Kofleriaceae bacterium]|nr:hypothetical protein [Kofleriaceae bacterium]